MVVARLRVTLAGVLMLVLMSMHAGAARVRAQALPQAEGHTQEPSAPAQTTVADAPPSAMKAPRWFGYQTLLVDGLGLATGILVTSTRDSAEPIGTMAAVWYGFGAVGAPAVHYAHGNVGTGLASAGLRMVLPPLAATIGMLSTCIARDDSFEDACETSGLIGGSLIGLAGAAALDAVFLADERHALRDTHDTRDTRDTEEEHWYGGQILLVDAIGLGAGLWLALDDPKSKNGEPMHPALSTWALFYTIGLIGAPIVHFAHGEVGAGFGSFALRLLLAPAGALPGVLGYCAATGGEKDCAGTGALWGLLGGALAVSLLDAFALAHEPGDAAQASSAYAPSLRIGPGAVALSGAW